MSSVRLTRRRDISRLRRRTRALRPLQRRDASRRGAFPTAAILRAIRVAEEGKGVNAVIPLCWRGSCGRRSRSEPAMSAVSRVSRRRHRADGAARSLNDCHAIRGGSTMARPPKSASHAATSPSRSRHSSSGTGGRISSHSGRNFPRSWSLPVGRPRNHTRRCVSSSPLRLTFTCATPERERIARSSRTVITPSSAASRLGRSPNSRCERSSRPRTRGSPVGRSVVRTRHRSLTHT